MLWSTILYATVLAETVAGRAVPDTHVVHEQRESTSRRWLKGNRAKPHATLPVRVGLAQSNLDRAHDFLMDVSRPDSPNYGKHWTADEVIKAFEPSNQTVQAVREWLVSSGIPAKDITHSDNKIWLAFDASTKQMESLLHTEYHEFEDTRTGGIMPACDSYHIPKHLQEHIDFITPGIRLTAPPGDKVTEEGWKKLERRGGPWQPPNGWPWGKPGWRPMPPNWSWPGWPQANPKDDLSNCDKVITPACIAALYKIPPAPSDPVEGNNMGIFEAELQYWDQLDLNDFFTNFTNIPNGTHPIDHDIDGGVARTTNISAAGGESMLDLDLSFPIVYPQNITVWNVDDIHYQTWANDTYTWGFNTLLDAIDGSYCTYSAYGETGDLAGVDPTYPDPTEPGGYNGPLQCGVFKPTNVFSLSYGGQEVDVPVAYQKRQCNEYLKLGLQGISFFFASGDTGVGDYPAIDGGDTPTGCLGSQGNIFNPNWPICPYITSVGATKLYPGHSVFEFPQPESAVFDPPGDPYLYLYASGGGFSNVFPIPDYQKSAVETFFAEHDPAIPYYSGLAEVTSDVYAHPNVTALAGTSGGLYNRIGRGYPDVSANGDNTAVYVNGSFGTSGGTSASTPIFASIINRINEERLKVGKKTVGFLNPALYAHPEVLNDITNGTNAACDGKGFDAVQGWDPVSGLGTPNFLKMLELFLSLP